MPEITELLEKTANNEVIRYYVQKNMFCGNSNCGEVLDYRTATAIKGDKYIVLCPKCWNKINDQHKAQMRADERIEITQFTNLNI